MGDTAPDNGVRKDACVDRRTGTVRRPPKVFVFFKGPVPPARLNTHTSFSRCCFCQFDSITVIIMEGTAPDNYSIKGNKKLFIVNPATDK